MRRVSLVVCLLAALPSAASAFSYSEGIDGDLSGDRLNPTALVADIGSNTLTGTTVAGDLEYVRITLPPGAQLSSLVLVSFVSTDNIAFTAVQEGTVFTVDPDTATEPDLLGYHHFGTGSLAGGATPGNDMLDDMGVAFGAIGFVPPLTGTDYTFWIQQINAQPVDYSFDYVVMPEPSLVAALGPALGLVALLARRRRTDR